MNKTALLIIDPQNDFTDPKGSLYIPGAENDMKRLGIFIDRNKQAIDDIVITLDDHSRLDIAHPMWWVDENGKQPAPFTLITRDDVVNGKMVPSLPESKYTDWSEHYVNELERLGNEVLVIWPEHCISGTWGSNISDDILEGLKAWEDELYNAPNIVRKGISPLSEHYSPFRAEVVADPDTELNTELIEDLKQYNHIIVAGEALSHCLGKGVKDMVEFGIDPTKITVLEECTSAVPTFEELGESIKTFLVDKGVTFSTVDDYEEKHLNE